MKCIRCGEAMVFQWWDSVLGYDVYLCPACEEYQTTEPRGLPMYEAGEGGDTGEHSNES